MRQKNAFASSLFLLQTHFVALLVAVIVWLFLLVRIALMDSLVVIMMKKVTVCTLLAVFANVGTFVLGFAPRASFVRGPSFALFAEEEKKETLTFNADLELISDAVPSEHKEEFARFFGQKDCRDLFLSAGGTRPVKELSMDEADLINLWKESCEHWGSSMLPEDDDIIVAVETSIRFPGLTLVTHTCSGVKAHTKEDGSVNYDMVLIGERNEPRGLAAMVWIFNQLTGNESKPKDRYLTPTAKALVKISIVEKDDSYAVKYHMDFQIDIEFPKVLLRILPTSKEKMEEQGSSSVRKTLTKDVIQALDAVCSKFQHNQSVPAESILL